MVASGEDGDLVIPAKVFRAFKRITALAPLRGAKHINK
jgi:hypothetical protein